MTGLERIGAILQGKKPDRRPFALLISLYGANYVDNEEINDYYRDPNIWIKGQIQGVKKFDPDIVTGPFCFPLEAEAFGAEIILTNDNAPNVKKPIIKDLADINNLKLPELDSPSLAFILQSTKLLVNKYKGNKAIAALIFSPCDLPALLLGIEKWVDTLLFHNDYVEKLLNITLPHFVRMSNKCLEYGANFVVTTANFVNPDIVNNKIFNILKPYLVDAFSKVNGPIVIHHGGCRMGEFIKYYTELPNVAGLIIDPRDDLKKARILAGEKTLLLGNVNGPRIETMSTNLLLDKCSKIIDITKDDPNFIFATSNADISIRTKEDKILGMIEIIKNG